MALSIANAIQRHLVRFFPFLDRISSTADEDPNCSHPHTFFNAFDGMAHTFYLHLDVYKGNSRGCTVLLKHVGATTFDIRGLSKVEAKEQQSTDTHTIDL